MKDLAGALASMLRENWQPGPTESEIQDQLWRHLDTVDDGFPLSNEKVTDDSRIAYLVSVYEGKKHTAERTGEGKCVCGDSSKISTEHRKDGPCYYFDPEKTGDGKEK